MNAKITHLKIYVDYKRKIDRVNVTLSFGDNTGLATGSFYYLKEYNEPLIYLKNLKKICGVNSDNDIEGSYIRVNDMKPGQQLQYMQHILYDNLKMNTRGELIQ